MERLLSMVSLASDVRLRISAQRWGGCAFQATDHHDQLNTPDTHQNDWGMAITHEPSEIAMTLVDLARSTSYVLAIDLPGSRLHEQAGLQLGLQFTTVRRRPGTTGHGRQSSLNRSGRP